MAHMFLCSSVMVGDSGIETKVGSWLTKELILLLSRVSASVSLRSLNPIQSAKRQIGVDSQVYPPKS